MEQKCEILNLVEALQDSSGKGIQLHRKYSQALQEGLREIKRETTSAVNKYPAEEEALG